MNDQAFTIDTEIPIPEGGSRLSYPWDQLQHGHSISVEDEKQARSAVQSARVWVKKQRPGWKVVSRRNETGTRIWFLNTNEGEAK